MKKVILTMLIMACAFGMFAEESEALESPSMLVAPNFFGLIIGYYGADVNAAIGDNMSLDTQFGYWNIRNLPFVNESMDPDNQFWYGYLKTGPTFYLDQVFHGLYFGAYAKATYVTIGDSYNNVAAGAAGVGAKAGWRGTWDWFSLALNVGYEYNKFFAEVNAGGVNESYISQINGGAPLFGIEMGFAIY